ncbi:MAG: flagellar filament capping protein FliD [Gemmatimonadales bacterium]
MSTPTSSVSGLVSGIQWRDLIDQIITAESAPATQARAKVTANNSKLTTYKTYRTLLETLRTSVKKLRDGSAFDGMTASAVITSGIKQLATASAGPTAQAGSYTVQVTSLAAQQKLMGTTQASSTTALGLSGQISVNGGAAITISATDTLSDIRDRISVANTGASPSKVTASVLSIGASSNRLVLTSDTLGSTGMTLSDVSGNVLQTLGLLSAPSTIAPAAVVQAGTDAVFSINGVPLTRTSNTVTDALAGVTLQLTAAELGAVTTLTVDRSGSSAKSAMTAVTDAYNAVAAFLKEQGTPPADTATKPVLYGESLLRIARGSLPSTLQRFIGGAAIDLNSAGLAGLSLQADGKLALDSAKFDALFSGRLADLRSLFQQQGSTTTGVGLTYLAAPMSVSDGTYPVTITTLATRATVTGAGLAGGIFSDDATPDTMTVTDAATAKTATITLTDGMTSTQIAAALTAAFTAAGLGLTATDSGGQVTLDQPLYGSSGSITVAYTAGGTLSGTLPIAAGVYAGVDVAGTINGEAATGAGQSLVSAVGTTVAGLSLLYSGTTLGAAGTATISLGTGALLERMLDDMVQSTTGVLSKRESSLTEQMTTLNKRADAIDARLERRRASLTKQYVNMEIAISKLQNSSSSLLATINNVNSFNNA